MKLEIEIKTITFRGELQPDCDTSPTDFDIFDPVRYQAWRDDEWSYLGIVCVADTTGVINDKEVSFTLQGPSLWGIESDDLNGFILHTQDLAEEFRKELGLPEDFGSVSFV